MKEKKGVTLLALTITIIILLLLVGVTLSVSGDGGILKNANNVAEQTRIEKMKSEIEEIIVKKWTSSVREITIEQIIEALEKKGIVNEGEGNPDNGQIKTQPDGYIYEIKEEANGNWKVEYQKPVNWEQAKNNATKPSEQTDTNDIGLDKYGKIVNMDNWDKSYEISTGTCELIDSNSGDSWTSGYLGEFDSEGKIEGEVPQWIKRSEDNKWYEVIYVSFKDETELEIAPELPTSLTDMTYTFYGCSNLVKAPAEIPTGVTDMIDTFNGCSSLVKAPAVIPASVTDMDGTFYGCSSLITAPKILSGVTNMHNTFFECSSLVTAPAVIPASVTDVTCTFYRCSSLTGEIKFLSTSLSGGMTFSYASTNTGTNLVVKAKTQDILDELESMRKRKRNI